MNYKQCCIECRFRFFNEDECPNCEAERMTKQYQSEWDRQLRLLERTTGIKNNEGFWMLWHSENNMFQTWFRNTCQQLAPEIYGWYMSLEKERQWEQHMEPRQLEIFEQNLPF